MDNRVDALRALLEQDPNNSFVRYGLAMEVARSGDLETAVAEFEALILANPDYSAAYYHGGQTLERLGRVDQARDIYERGIQATTRNGDAHTRAELQAALDLLPI
jgi:tetratricopeptide (TPR) repeat protein